VFKELQGWSLNMLAVGVARFENLASGFDADARRVGVWALQGGAPEDAQLTLHVLNGSISAWSEFTNRTVPELGKLDMVIWNGASPWSSSQIGFLFMDRFRTLWNQDYSTASDLIRAAHITCHEVGHTWFGGVVQTLNQTAFIEESTTSYGEVFCVTKVLPKALGNALTVQRAFFPAYGDSRLIHVGAEFHAIDNLLTPEHVNDSIVSSFAAFYTKGAALLHMLESYADASVRQVLCFSTLLFDFWVQFWRTPCRACIRHSTWKGTALTVPFQVLVQHPQVAKLRLVAIERLHDPVDQSFRSFHST
jgi:aminopeptidase N